MPRLKIGDIVEIRTSKGFAYAQYTHKNQLFGTLLRVLPGIYPEPLDDFSDLVTKKEQFVTFFPLGAAVHRGIVRIVKNMPVPESAQQFHTFRAGVVDPATGKVAVWWLWDGEREWRVDELTPEQRKFPMRGAWNDTLLIERIESGWTPETDPR